MKILVITSEPISAADLRAAVGGEAADDAEVLVVAPALHSSPLRFWLSDADTAIAAADEVQSASVEQLGEEGITATGDTGESEPRDAVEDTLAKFPADRILVFSHPDGDQDYREGVDVAEVERRFGLPTTQHTIAR
ncbi:MAG: hypothetical protein QOF77_559 [Solirubrobacteraceae bacterium]|nr:hypothetical protein [Solirubrobacteraceae bacterium]